MLFGDTSRPLKGYVTSHDLEMTCLVTELNPEGTVIGYRYDGTGLELGDSREGTFCIITNQGETTLKYHCSTVSASPVTSMGQIDNLYQFIKLARKNWTEACSFFASPYFSKIIENEEQSATCLYKGVKKSSDPSLALEEFLIGIGKKSPVCFETETQEINLVSAIDITQEKVSIIKEGWGYCTLNVLVKGAFLSTEKRKVDWDDFLGNRCRININIDSSRLHAGRNYGCVIFKNEYTSIEIPVCIVNVRELTLGYQNKNKERIIQGVKEYIEYALGKIEYDEFARAINGILGSIVGRREQNSIRDLVRAHLHFDEGKYNEGRFLLKNAEKQLDFTKEDDEIYCYSRYLNWLADKNSSVWKKVYDEIKAIQRRSPGNWRIAWLVINMNKERPKGSENWRILEECYRHDCRSPLMYLEGLKFLEENMGRMTNPSEFVIQVLLFATKNNYLSDDMIFQIHYLAGRIKKYNPAIERILRKCFEIKNDDESLFALCTHIMKRKHAKEEYFSFFEEAISRQLRVGGIYEAYLESAMEAEIPDIHENAIRYLFYQDSLTVDKKAFLYSRIVALEKKKPEIYQLFKRDMIEFTVEQFEEGSINRDFAVLYKQFIQSVYVRPEYINKFMSIFSCNEVKLKSGDEDRIVVMSSIYENETIHELRHGSRCVPVWGPESCVLLMSKEGKIFRCPDRLEFSPLFSKDEILSVISRLDSDVSEVLMSIFFDGDDRFKVDEKNYELIRNICKTRKLAKQAEAKLTMHLMRFYASEEMKDELEDLLLSASVQDFSPSMRSEIIDVMCVRRLYEKAFSWLVSFGTDGISPYNLTAVCHHLINRRENISSDILLKLVYKVYLMGYYTKRMLIFLAEYYNGSCNDMWKLRNACKGFLVENQSLNERLIKRITHTGKHLKESSDVYKSYVAGGGHTKVALAYIAAQCRECFKNSENLPEVILKDIKRMYAAGTDLSDDIQLETLRTLANQEEIYQEDSAMISHMIETFIFGRELFFDFFKLFVDVCPLVALYQDKTVLEYTAKNGERVVLHYVMNTDGDSHIEAEPVYVACEMERGYNGTFAKEFILFFGDRVDYYITEGDLQGGRLAAQGSLVCTDTNIENRDSRYGLINGMSRSVSLGNIDEAKALYEIYEEREQYSEGLFSLL